MLAQARRCVANRRHASIFRAFFPFFRESELLREADKAAARAERKEYGGGGRGRGREDGKKRVSEGLKGER